MSSPLRFWQFTASPWLVRMMAAERTGTDALEWVIVSKPAGAPACVARDSGLQSGLHVSISHSGDQFVAAVAPFSVGIDVEATGRERGWLGLARMVISAEDRDLLSALPLSARERVIRGIWTLNEARAKRLGSGLGLAAAKSHRPIKAMPTSPRR